MNSINLGKGQSLIELIIAIGIFITVISGLAFFVLNSYLSGLLASEITMANFLAEEGIEAARSIRDNSWDDLLIGNHGLAISGNHWVFQGSQEDISSELKEGKRIITIKSVDSDRKKITSKVNWQFNEGKSQEVQLITYFTNWQKITRVEIRKPTAHTDSAGRTTRDSNAYDYPDGTTYATTHYDATADPSITFHTWQLATQSYTSLVLKYRYHAQAAGDDRYAITYSTTGCSGTFTDLVSPTSAGASDTIISVNLSPSQDLSQLCLKIYSIRTGQADHRRLYTRDVWAEGIY
ncbi:hypothetical protein KJA15_04280 [Patescibacteria group bacterium]|nr:hypothetical protein [Patescibacteria group bacterium]